MRYCMVIDLKRCIGCMACTVACKVENMTLNGVFWHAVKDQEFGTYPNVKRAFLPTPCMHCKEAPCVEVCPTGASYYRDDGIVAIDESKCTGCGYCIEACPYGVRTLNKEIKGAFGNKLIPIEEVSRERHKVGVVGKCTFCLHLVSNGEEPACVRTCVGNARFFGDLEDPESKVSQLIRLKRGFQLKKELGTDPSVYYLPL